MPATSSLLFALAAVSISLASAASVIQKHTSYLGFSGSCNPTMLASPLSRQKVGTALSASMICCFVSAFPGGAAAAVSAFSFSCSAFSCSAFACAALFSAMAAFSSASSSSAGARATRLPLPLPPLPMRLATRC